MSNFFKAIVTFENFNGWQGNEPTTKAEYDGIKDGTFVNGLNEDEQVFSGTAPTWEEIQTKVSELDAADQAKIDLKASAKAKLMAGEALTEDEANTIVL